MNDFFSSSSSPAFSALVSGIFSSNATLSDLYVDIPYAIISVLSLLLLFRVCIHNIANLVVTIKQTGDIDGEALH